MNRLIYRFLKRINLPRGFVLGVDCIIVLISFYLAYILRLNFDIVEISFRNSTFQLLFFILPIYLGVFLITGSYQGILRHSSIDDAGRMSVAVIIATITILGIALALRLYHVSVEWMLPYSVVFIHAALVSVGTMGFRLVARALYYTYILHHEGYRRVLVFGAGETGKITLNMLESNHNSRIHVLGFIDDDKNLIGKRLEGKPIYAENYVFRKMLKYLKISEIILATERLNMKPERRKALFEKCLKSGVNIREVSPFENWQDGKLSEKHIRDVRIEELLGRDPIQLDMKKISKGLENSVVLVTGAAGSIGSEIVRQLLTFDMAKVILLDQAESPLYDLQNELLRNFPHARFEVVLASVTDRRRMRHIFEKYRPKYVFNAAAYKHVPLMEVSPYEAIRVNIGGTCLLADLAVEFGVQKFVMISTDKAINPTNVMGASKRICEIYIQALAQSNHIPTQFITTRFGNVLGSNGSVIPLFKKQIENGGPVTVTHKDIIRYFMTIPEACQLVLEAGFMGNGGEIFMFDMGQPVKIYDLACKMIYLAGFQPEEEIPIHITGLRPGEKLFEELLTDQEKTIPTHHSKIKLAKVPVLNFGNVKFAVDALLIAMQVESETELVCRMKSLVPEFVSQNSEFEKYDPIVVRRKQQHKRRITHKRNLMESNFPTDPE